MTFNALKYMTAEYANSHLYEQIHINRWDQAKTLLFGFELELEGTGCRSRAGELAMKYPDEWRTVDDGSLRGEAIELIFNGPLTKVQSYEALRHVGEGFDGWDTKGMSPRCSVHVHVNIAHFQVKELHSLLTLLLLVENALFRRAGGADREGNLFCLRTCDSEEPLRRMVQVFQNSNMEYLFRGAGNNQRYANINTQAFQKFGTIEIRCHKGTANAEELSEYLGCIDELFSAGKSRFSTPQEIMQHLSYRGPAAFVKEVLPATYKYLGMEDDELTEWIEEALDYAQELAYCVYVSEPEPELELELKPRAALGAKKKARIKAVVDDYGAAHGAWLINTAFPDPELVHVILPPVPVNEEYEEFIDD